jgi:FKBP-type peptidyl-prolyl cis-trans isomerase (trigger factor)
MRKSQQDGGAPPRVKTQLVLEAIPQGRGIEAAEDEVKAQNREVRAADR